jgi:hypothetical protein
MIRQHIVSYCMASSLAALMLAPAAGAEVNWRGGAPNAQSAAGRQQMVHLDFCAQSRHGLGEVGISADSARRMGLRRRQ